MKRTTYLIGATFAVLASLSSCQTSVEIESQPFQAPEIIASLETDSNTKSMVITNGEGVGTIYWTPADRINIFYGTTSTLYTSQNTENALTAVFRTTDIIGSNEAASDNIWGLYPYNENAVCDGSTVTTTIPSTQYAVPGTFDDDLFPTLAHSATNALKFYNVCGGIKFSLFRGDITQITFRGNNSEDLAGNVSLTFTNNVPAATVLSGAKEITLLPKTGSTFAQNTNYYLVLLPCALTSGFTMTFNTSSGSVGTFNYTTKAVNITRSVFSRKEDIDTYATFTGNSNIQFADAEFKSYCVRNFDDDGDGEISFTEASTVTSIYCSNSSYSGLASLEGIQYFTALTALGINSKQLASLDLSHNTALTSLDCSSNQLTSLDLSHNTALSALKIRYSQLASLDLSHNTALSSLEIRYSQLASLDLSHNTALASLDCSSNQLTSLDLSHNTALTSLDCSSNQLTSLDVSNNSALTTLVCSSNQLSRLNVSGCFDLTELTCTGNQLISIDISWNTELTELNCDSNRLSSIDVSWNTKLEEMSCRSNQLTNLDVTDCIALTTLDCYSNNLTSLVANGCNSLTTLHCSNNQLVNLDVSNSTALTKLNCLNNKLTSLNVNGCTSLSHLGCGGNKLSSLNLNENILLTHLDCSLNSITTLDVTNNTALVYLHVGYNNLSALNISNNFSLETLQCRGNKLKKLDVSNCPALTELHCFTNPTLTEIWLKTGQTITDFRYDTDVATIYYKD